MLENGLCRCIDDTAGEREMYGVPGVVALYSTGHRFVVLRQGQPGCPQDGGGYDPPLGLGIDRSCSNCLGHSDRTLDGYRVSGDGPAFHRLANRVRYRRFDLDAWAAERRTTTTIEADRQAQNGTTLVITHTMPNGRIQFSWLNIHIPRHLFQYLNNNIVMQCKT